MTDEHPDPAPDQAAAASLLPHDENGNWCLDAQVWAHDFLALHPDAAPCLDEGDLIGWFANAMQAQANDLHARLVDATLPKDTQQQIADIVHDLWVKQLHTYMKISQTGAAISELSAVLAGHGFPLRELDLPDDVTAWLAGGDDSLGEPPTEPADPLEVPTAAPTNVGETP